MHSSLFVAETKINNKNTVSSQYFTKTWDHLTKKPNWTAKICSFTKPKVWFCRKWVALFKRFRRLKLNSFGKKFYVSKHLAANRLDDKLNLSKINQRFVQIWLVYTQTHVLARICPWTRNEWFDCSCQSIDCRVSFPFKDLEFRLELRLNLIIIAILIKHS